MAYARFSGREGFGSVTPKLNELAILMVAKHWSANYVWNAHHAFAVQSGLPQEVVDAVLAGRRPARMERDVEAVYNFCQDFLTTRRVSDATLQAAKAVLGGDRGVIDLVGTMGLYPDHRDDGHGGSDAAGRGHQAVLPMTPVGGQRVVWLRPENLRDVRP
jgi:alkylhydroperoxidase family enzyme